MNGLLLDPHTGAVEGESTVDRIRRALAQEGDSGRAAGLRRILYSLGQSHRSAWDGASPIPRKFAFNASLQTWEELLNPYANLADGAQVLNTTTETIMVPDFSIPAGYMVPGRVLRYTLWGDTSTVVTTPGTVTFRLRWGGVAGTVLAASVALNPKVTVSTNYSYWLEFVVVCRTSGATGSMFCMGRVYLGQNAGAVGDIESLAIPQTAPAVVSSLDTTIAKALSPTIAFSVATATTQLTNHIATLESLS